MTHALAQHALRLGLVSICLAAGPVRAQTLPAQSAEQREHLSAVRTERSIRFHRAYLAADAERRAAAEAALEDLFNRAGPANAPPGLSDLAAATRVAEGAPAAGVRQDLLARVADTLDLQVVPGFFPAAQEGRGTPLTVRCYPLGKSHPLGEARVHLYWISPSGEETRARTQTVLPSALRAPGFDLFIRAPVTAPGLWRLVAELEYEGRRARSPSVPVECVAEAVPGEPSDSRDPDEWPPALAPLAGDLLRLERSGVRSGSGLLPSEVRARLAGDGPRAGLEPVAADSDEAVGLWQLRPVAEPTRALLFLAPSGESPGAVLGGPIGEAWRAMAERTGTWLFWAPFDEQAHTPAERIAAVRAAAVGLPVVAVARGDAESRLRIGLFRRTGLGGTGAEAAAYLPVDGLVVVSNSTGVGGIVGGLPTLVVDPTGEPASGAPDPPFVSRRRGAALVCLAEPKLPGLVADWLADAPSR